MDTTRAMQTHDLVSSYVLAKTEVVRAGYAHEIVWQDRIRLRDVSPTTFLREAAWVVLSAGMAEGVVRSRFVALGDALHGWAPHAICGDPGAEQRALKIFGHRRKIAAILEIAAVASAMERRALHGALQSNPEAFLRNLPYVGPVTWAHLAKNLGVPIAKADRHLARLSAAYQRESVSALCDEISGWLGEPVPVVDIVLWRYGSLHARKCRRPNCSGIPHGLP